MFTFDLANFSLNLKHVLYRFNPRKQYKEISRQSDGFIFYVKGSHIFHFENEKFEGKNGSLIYLPFGSNYTNIVKGEAEYYQIDFILKDKDGKPCSLFEHPVILDENLSAPFFPEIIKIFETYYSTDSSSKSMCISLLCKIISMSQKQLQTNLVAQPDIIKIQKAVSFLESHFLEDFSVQELAKLCYMGTSNLQKNFKKYLGTSPLNYKNTLRINYAKQLLLAGFSVSETAFKIGFIDIYYFSRLFKKITGTSPSHFARQARKI